MKIRFKDNGKGGTGVFGAEGEIKPGAEFDVKELTPELKDKVEVLDSKGNVVEPKPETVDAIAGAESQTKAAENGLDENSAKQNESPAKPATAWKK